MRFKRSKQLGDILEVFGNPSLHRYQGGTTRSGQFCWDVESGSYEVNIDLLGIITKESKGRNWHDVFTGAEKLLNVANQ